MGHLYNTASNVCNVIKCSDDGLWQYNLVSYMSNYDEKSDELYDQNSGRGWRTSKEETFRPLSIGNCVLLHTDRQLT